MKGTDQQQVWHGAFPQDEATGNLAVVALDFEKLAFDLYRSGYAC